MFIADYREEHVTNALRTSSWGGGGGLVAFMFIFYMDRCITSTTWTSVLLLSVITTIKLFNFRSETQFSFSVSTNINSEFTQQDCRKKRTAKCLCATNVTGLLLACSVMILRKFMLSALFKGRWSLRQFFLKQNDYCYAWNTRFNHILCSPSLLGKFMSVGKRSSHFTVRE